MFPDANNHSFPDTRKGNRYSSGTGNFTRYHIYIHIYVYIYECIYIYIYIHIYIYIYFLSQLYAGYAQLLLLNTLLFVTYIIGSVDIC